MNKQNPFRKLRTSLDDNLIVNELTFIDYLDRFKQVAMSIFEWVNLPTGMDSRFLEKTLYYDGKAAMLFDKDKGFMNLRCSANGALNMYELPTKLNCYSWGIQKYRTVFYGRDELNPARKEDECILVLNNLNVTPTAGSIELFAYRLYEAQRSCDTNIKQQKYPTLIVTDENQRLTMLNLYKKVNDNEQVIFGDSKLNDISKVKTFNTQAPYVADKLQEYIKLIWNDCLTFLGIQNLAEKKERLITSEASSNNELINLNLQARFAPRQEACRLFNEKYGTNISVKIRSDLYNIIKEQESIINDYQFNEDATTDLGDGVENG